VDDPLPPLFAFVKLFGERGLFTSAGFTFFSWAPRLMSAKRSLVLTAGAGAELLDLNVVGGGGGGPPPFDEGGGGGAPRDVGGVTREFLGGGDLVCVAGLEGGTRLGERALGFCAGAPPIMLFRFAWMAAIIGFIDAAAELPPPPLPFDLAKLFGERGLFTSVGFTFFSLAPFLISARRSLVLTVGGGAELLDLNDGGGGGGPPPAGGGGGPPRRAGGGGVPREGGGGTLRGAFF